MSDKEVYYNLYCKHCEHFKEDESSDVCNECLNSPFNYDSHKPIKYSGETIKPIDMYGYYSNIKYIKDYFYEIEYNKINYDYALDYFKQSKDIQVGACSAFKSWKYVGRNLDWNYNNQAGFLVRLPRINNRYKSYGIGGGLSKLTNDFVETHKYSDLYKIIPFNMYDGINEFGVYANINVVPNDYGNNFVMLDGAGYEFNGQMLIRFILDNFQTAKDAVKFITKNVNLYFSKQLHAMDYETHYFIADINNVYILEIINNEYKVIECDLYSPYIPAITNFHMYGVKLNDDHSVYTPEFRDGDKNAESYNLITPHGSGLERFNIIANNLKSRMSKSEIWNILNELKYTKTYSTAPIVSNPYWYTEFVSKNGLTVSNDVSDFKQIVNKYGCMFEQRDRNTGLTWQTVHSVLYDLENKSMEIILQEDGEKLKYTF